MKDTFFHQNLQELDEKLYDLNRLEEERQFRRLILIPSESMAPKAVREALSGAFTNIYAEGYPNEYTRWQTEEEILDYKTSLPFYRRYADPRYYKGVEYADVVESLARRRVAEAFAANGLTADDLFVNVQALSGGPANNAVFHALVKPGDTVMSMDLLHGGHLSHGSPVNRSGKYYDIVHYSVDPETERLNYDRIQEIAQECKPSLIIGGFSSYPWQMDWHRMRAIADEVGANLLADIAHVAGLVVSGHYPSPIGIADVVTSTTHKSLMGPRGAIIISSDAEISGEIDRAVFPGEQGGPHVNVFSALALTMKIAQTQDFADLQGQIVKNCKALTDQLGSRGMKIAFAGTNTHLMNLDVRSVKGEGDVTLKGDQASRLLDLIGIVVNRNTIPSDTAALDSSGVRMGTPWITQFGFKEAEMVELADIIADLFDAVKPIRLKSRTSDTIRGKVPFDVLEDLKIRVRKLTEKFGAPYDKTGLGYPHSYYRDEEPKSQAERIAYELGGERIRTFLAYTFTSDTEALKPGDIQPTSLHLPDQKISGTLKCLEDYKFLLSLDRGDAVEAASWLRALSDGYVMIDEDLLKKPMGPIWVVESEHPANPVLDGQATAANKPWYIGIENAEGEALPEFSWEEKETDELLKTVLNETHRELGARMVPFAGWDMPVWYTSVSEEHNAVRDAAGLFDVSHMGVLQAEGPDAALFLNAVCANDLIGNDINRLEVGRSLYTQFLDQDANVIDDLLVYRRAEEKYLVVVNASNMDKDWAWLQAVINGEVMVDRQRPWAKAFGRNVILRDLRKPDAGDEMRIDIALQGPKACEVLLAMCDSESSKKAILKLERTYLCQTDVGGFDVIVSRTGYTGEEMGFELFVHPEQAVGFWNSVLKAGEPMGLKPCGLASRDSLRTEYGLPLYGHEMAGPLKLGVAESGFRTYVKTYKPWFIGRDAFIEKEKTLKQEIVRFRFMEKVRPAHLGDPVVDKRGRVIGKVTSCAIDYDGLLTGLALVDKKHTAEGTPLFIYQSAGSKVGKAPAELEVGDRTAIPTQAVVLSRFPMN